VQDSPLLLGELVRELSYGIPFGSKQTNLLDEVEDYFIVNNSLSPLYESANSTYVFTN